MRWGLAGLALLGLSGWLLWPEPARSEAEQYRLTEAELASLEPGDIILRRGSGIVSDFIAQLLREPYDVSHCGIIVEHDSALWVVHSVSSSLSDFDGMQAHRLPVFVAQSKPRSVVVSRLRTEKDRGRIALRAKEYLRRQVPFDHHFDLEDSTTIYCSELVWRILRDDYEVDVFGSGAASDELGRYRFARFTDTARFDIVLSHQKQRPRQAE